MMSSVQLYYVVSWIEAWSFKFHVVIYMILVMSGYWVIPGQITQKSWSINTATPSDMNEIWYI